MHGRNVHAGAKALADDELTAIESVLRGEDATPAPAH